MELMRIFRHLSAGRWLVARRFPKHSLRTIEAAIHDSESGHMGELRFAVDVGLEWGELLAGTTPRQRAVQVFSQLGVWDTEHNSGVLIYLLLADRDVEIVADRGIHARVGDARWAAICQDMEKMFRNGGFESGVLHGIAAISALLREHYPAQSANSNELSDRPVIL